MEGIQKSFRVALHLISQHYLLLASKDLFNPYKKRMDFDYLMVISKLEKIV